MRSDLATVAAGFIPGGTLVDAEPFAGGHIHRSYRVTLMQNGAPAGFLLQQLNATLFDDPEAVMHNVVRVTAHLAAGMARVHGRDLARRVLTPVPAAGGGYLVRDGGGGCWRMYTFVEASVCLAVVREPSQAEAAARAFGEFQRLLADWRGPRLHETIRDFHHTPRRLAALEAAVRQDRAGRAASVRDEIAQVLWRREEAAALMDLRERGLAPERIVHNDAKLANVLFDAASGEALCVVDLDTVMPGLSLFDFGDMVRSMTALAEEDDAAGGNATHASSEVDLARFEAVARGYLSQAGPFLLPVERAHLVAAGRVITLEQAARFLTDYLDGDRYYQTTRREQNLDRCRSQLMLLESLERRGAALERIVAGVAV